MRLLVFIFIFIINALTINAQTAITPNNGLQGETLQVFISGNQSHFSQNSSCMSYLELQHTQHSWKKIDVPNNVGNWTYNSNIGDSGFFSTITIPNGRHKCYAVRWPTQIWRFQFSNLWSTTDRLLKLPITEVTGLH